MGEETISFDLSESVTTFKVMVDGLAKGPEGMNAVLGSSYSDISSEMKFTLDAQLPVEVSEADKIDIPVLVHVDESLLPVRVQFMAQGFLLDTDCKAMTITKPGQRVIVCGSPKLPTLSQRPTDKNGNFTDKLPEDAETGFNGSLSLGGVAIAHDGQQFWDGCKRSFRVKARGFPIKASMSDILNCEKSLKIEADIPEYATVESMMANIVLNLSPVGSLVSALNGLIREPYGCFEQTSSSTYPLVMAMNYFKTHTDVPPEMVENARVMLQKGHDRLVGYECKTGGFEWFGSDPAHESLTAYGLMEFQDMSAVFPVKPELIERTREWLLSRRSDTGEFLRNARALDSFGSAPSHITNAYIIYALTGENGDKQIDLQKEVDYLVKLAEGDKCKDPYFLALVSIVMFQRGINEKALHFARQLTSMQILEKAEADSDKMPYGSLDMVHASTTITNSYGRSLAVETAAMATLAWMNFPSEFMMNATSIIEFLHSRCTNGTFGSTQATVLALKAIIAFDELMSKAGVPGALWIKVNDELVDTVNFDPKDDSKVTVSGTKILEAISIGSHNTIECGVKPQNGQEDAEMRIPGMCELFWRSNEPVSCENPPVLLDVQLMTPTENTMSEGDGAQMNVKVMNKSGDGTGMVIAIVGIPGGIALRTQRLKELVKMNKIAFFETRGRDLILYWRCMEVDSEIEVTFDVTAKTPGHYIAPASCAYMYYCSELKYWMKEQELLITPANEE
eukprot:TRINITY_DN1230_c0_g5_i1.p1 TRINITY_DN1230_c0_g5~~TRINITY_DN1230_c0_g5_i1.p1  ORF type:complete len:798 (-),score=285.80 TRINITY_DN1230_c0_g5_i1:162-2369(-)